MYCKEGPACMKQSITYLEIMYIPHKTFYTQNEKQKIQIIERALSRLLPKKEHLSIILHKYSFYLSSAICTTIISRHPSSIV